MPNLAVRVAEEINTVRKEAGNITFAQHGLIPNDGTNEIRPDDMFEEVDVPDVLVDKKGYPVRFTDGVYDRLGEELVTNGDFSDGLNGWSGSATISNDNGTANVIGNASYNIQQNIQTEVGKTYIVNFNITANIGNTLIRAYVYDGKFLGIIESIDIKRCTFMFNATKTKHTLSMYSTQNNGNFNIGMVTVKELPQFQLPKAPFSSGSTDELLNDKDNGLTTQTDHSKGDIVVCGNELVTNGGFDSDTDWTKGDGWSISDGLAIFSGTAQNSRLGVSVNLDLIVGAEYVVEFNCLSLTDGLEYNPQIVAYDGSYILNKTFTAGIVSHSFTPTSSSVFVFIEKKYTVQNDITIDNISVKLKDQSYIALQDTTAGQTIDDMPELVSNGSCDDINAWNTNTVNAVVSIDNGKLKVDDSDGAGLNSSARQNISLISGRVYLISYTIVSTTTNGAVLIWSGADNNTQSDSDVKGYTPYDAGAITEIFTSGYTGEATIGFCVAGDGITTFDNISVKELPANDLRQTPNWKPIPYVTKQAALLIEKTSQGAILNTVKPLVNMYGEESVETYESDIFSELGYSQKADRVFTDGSSEFILLGLKGYLNGGVWHPWFNEFGSRKITYSGNAEAFWHENTSFGMNLYNAMRDYNSSDSTVGFNISTGYIISNKSGRPSNEDDTTGKFYDKCYINGQGGLICFSIPNANKPTYKHQEEVRRNLVDGYIENGVELLYANTIVLSGTTSDLGRAYCSYTCVFPTDTFANQLFGNGGNSLDNNYKAIISSDTGEWLEVTATANNQAYINSEYSKKDTYFTDGNSYIVAITKKSPYLATMGTTTHTDIIGDPSPYNSSDAEYIANDGADTDATDLPIDTYVWDANTSTMWKTKVDTIDLTDSTPSVAIEEGDNWTEIKKGYPQSMRNLLASGKGVGFMNSLLVSDNGDNLIPDGISKEYKLSKKSIDATSKSVFSSDSGNSWIFSDRPIDQIGNYNKINWDANQIAIYPVVAQNQPAISIQSPKPIQTVDRDLIASNHHSVYAYNGLTYAASGKVATGNSVEAKGVDDVTCYYGYKEIVDRTVGSTKGDEVGDVLKLGSGKYIDFVVELVYQDPWYRTMSKISDMYVEDGYLKENGYSFFKILGIESTPTHQTLNLDNQSIVASKTLLTQTSNATQVFTQEMVYDATIDRTDDFTTITTQQELVNNTKYYLDGTQEVFGVLAGKYVTFVSTTATYTDADWMNIYIVGNKAYYRTDDSTVRFIIWDGNGFGDSNEFDQLTDGTETDLNGNQIQTKVLLKASSISMGDK